jgi:RNA polymerase sigma factor (sigma-70 family)
MASSRIEPILQHLRQTMLRRDEAGLTDGQLLERFLNENDAAAFEGLVRRHGRMVLGVCRRVVGDPHDADDCFQATFLVLVRKAASISPPDKVGNWLYGVAHTTAVRAKADKAKRQRRERHVSKMPEPEETVENHRDDEHELLDEELARLPEKYRTAIVLCDLEGRPRKEVARQMKIPEGTLSSRLTTGRRMLAQRLTRRGLAVSAGSLATILMHQAATACVPAALTTSTVKAALLVAAGKTITTAAVSLQAAILTEGVLKTMLLTKLKLATAATLLAVFLAGGAGLIYQTHGAESTPAIRADVPKPDKPASAAKAKTDQERLQGPWRCTKSIKDGKEDQDEEEWTFRDGTLRMKTSLPGTAGRISFWRYKLDTTATPKRIDMVIWEKDFTDKDLKYCEEKAEGIYALDGETLILCFGREEGKRPTAFEGKKGSALCTFHKAAGKKDTPRKQKKPNPRPKSATTPKAEENLPDIILHGGNTPQRYNEIFENVLDVLDDSFEIAYANRYEGRIESKPQRGAKDAIERRAIVGILCEDDGTYRVGVEVRKEKAADGKVAQPTGRDTELEQTIYRRLIELDRRRQTEEKGKREEGERKTPNEDRQNSLLLRNVHLDAKSSDRKISVVTLRGHARNLTNLPVATDAKIHVKGGNAFANLKIGMRLQIELSVRDEELVVTAIRQEKRAAK